MKKRIEFVFIFVIFFALSFINAATYGSGTYGTDSYGIEEEAAETPATPSGGGGGGCNYNWECTDWFPSECPVEEIQERVCINRGTCEGTGGMPEQNRTCVYEHPEPLFDIFMTIAEKSKQVCAGKKISAAVDLENYGDLELLDAFMTYWILDEDGSLISELKDTRSVSDEINFSFAMKIPEETPVGTYRLYSEITYSGNKTAVAGESFEVIDNDSCGIIFEISPYLPFIVFGAGFFLILVIVIVLLERMHHQKKPSNKIGFLERRRFAKEKHRLEKERRMIFQETLRQKRMIEKKNYSLREKVLEGEKKRLELKEKLRTEQQKLKQQKPKRVFLRPKTKKRRFVIQMRLNREKRMRERKARKLARELEMQRRKGEKENRKAKKRRQKEHQKQMRQQRRRQEIAELKYRKSVRKEKRLEGKTNTVSSEPAIKIKKTKKEKPVSWQEDLMKQREI